MDQPINADDSIANYTQGFPPEDVILPNSPIIIKIDELNITVPSSSTQAIQQQELTCADRVFNCFKLLINRVAEKF